MTISAARTLGFLWAATLTAQASCSSQSDPIRFPTSPPPEPSERGAPAAASVPLDPRAEASTDERSVVLATPVSTQHASRLVRAYFSAITTHSIGALEPLFATKEQALREGANLATAARVLSDWRRRFARLDYTQLEAEVLYHDRELEVYRASEWEQLQSRRESHLTPRGSQLLIVVPLRIQKKAKVRYFGTRVEMVVSTRGADATILEVYEDFQLPY